MGIQIVNQIILSSLIILSSVSVITCGRKRAEKKRQRGKAKRTASAGAFSSSTKSKVSFRPQRLQRQAQEGTPQAPKDRHKFAGTKDPNYQTLADVNQELAFGPDKKKHVGDNQQIRAGEKKFVGTFDPNYQTLVGLDNNLVFGDDKNANAPQPIKPGEKVVVAQNDPNYQTLANLQNEEAFGADKKKQVRFGNQDDVYGEGYLDIPGQQNVPPPPPPLPSPQLPSPMPNNINWDTY